MILRAISLVSILCIATLLFAGVNAIDVTQKPDKSGKPDKPGSAPEDVQWMQFDGDLSGAECVEGCCPNAGPFPVYDNKFRESFKGT